MRELLESHLPAAGVGKLKRGEIIMNTKVTILCFILILIPLSAFSVEGPSYKSKYAGEEKRKIKTLSENDIEELKNGEGWGLAKAAELNGIPGPAHLLEMKKEINLSSRQVQAIEDLYDKMKQEAIPLGLELIELEKELNDHFADRTITYELLDVSLEKIAQVQKKLRYVHLSTHLKTPEILTPEQIVLYNKLRGYSTDDPCKNIPEGHDPEMWKRHNNCP
jgi:Spy/CpxP family protein refolding chaperone